MAKFISSVQRYMKVDEATSSKDEVTPVYLLDDVYRMAQPGQDVAGLVEHLIKRLQHRSPVVKYKTLRVIKYVAGKQAPEFKRLFARHAASIRELTHYKGEPDAFKGDVPNQRVRDLAKEALDTLFAVQEAPSYSQQNQNTALKGRIQGFGSVSNPAEPGASGAGPAPTGSSKYVGFGNPQMPPPQQSASSTATATLDMAKQWLTTAGQAVGLTTKAHRSMLEEDSHYGGSHYSGNQGGGSHYSGSHGGSAYSTYSAPSGGRATPAAPVYGPNSAAAAASRGPAIDGSDEQRIVASICTPGGLRPQPDKADLATFVEGVSILDGDRVAQLLAAVMRRGPWQATFRALCALEAVITQGNSSSCGQIAVHFQADPSFLEQAARSTQASVRIRASAVLRLLGAEAAAPAAGAGRRAAPAPAQPEKSLLDFGDEPAATGPANGHDSLADLLGGDSGGAPAVSTAGGEAAGGLFAGLDLAGGGQAGAVAHPAAAAAGGDDLFGGLSVAQQGPATAAAPGDSLSSLLGQLDMSGGVSTSSSVPASTAAGVSPSSSLGDLLNTMPSAGFGSSGSYASLQQQQPAGGGMRAGGMMPVQPGMMPATMGMHGHLPQMPMGAAVPPGAVMVMPGMAPHGMAHSMMMYNPMMQNGGMMPHGMVPMMQPMMSGNMQEISLSKSALGPMGGVRAETGPIPLEAFSTANPTPKIIPKHPDADKFDFVGDVVRSKSSMRQM